MTESKNLIPTEVQSLQESTFQFMTLVHRSLSNLLDEQCSMKLEGPNIKVVQERNSPPKLQIVFGVCIESDFLKIESS